MPLLGLGCSKTGLDHVFGPPVKAPGLRVAGQDHPLPKGRRTCADIHGYVEVICRRRVASLA